MPSTSRRSLPHSPVRRFRSRTATTQKAKSRLTPCITLSTEMRYAAAVIVAILLAAAMTSPASAQRRGRFFGPRIPDNPKYDGAFQFCRIYYRNASDGDGGGWSVDYPRADINLTFRLSELTTTLVSQDPGGNYNAQVLNLTDALTLSKCPFTMITEPAAAYFDQTEAEGLRTYLQRGGFLWADDFWGEYAWEHWERELRKALPSGQFTIQDLPMDHPIFHVLYDVRELTQIPSINFWAGTGGATSERGQDSAVPHARGAFDADGHMLVFMTHNTDFGDAFEREGDMREYFQAFASKGYAVGINVLLYALTH